jgi:putative membrane protein
MQFAQYYQNYGPMMDRWGHDSWIGAVFGLLFFLLIVALAILVLKTVASGRTSVQPHTREPLDIAKERYAKGEITKDELTEMKKELK